MLVPVGGEFSAGRVLPGVNWLYGWDLNEFWSLAGSSQYNISVDELTAKVHGEVAQSVTLGQSWHPRVGSYTEWFMLAPNGAETEVTEHYFNGGFIFRVNHNLQLDVRAGTGLSSQATDFFSPKTCGVVQPAVKKSCPRSGAGPRQPNRVAARFSSFIPPNYFSIVITTRKPTARSFTPEANPSR
jgi:hypothetical protein